MLRKSHSHIDSPSPIYALVNGIAGKLVLVVLATIVTAFLLEVMTRILYPQPLNYYNFTLIQAEGGADMVLGSGKLASHERRRGYGPYRPKLAMQFGGVDITINTYGWRDSDYTLAKPDDVTRIMVLGDSVTFGYGVQLEDMFQKVLERQLNRQGTKPWQVISMGGAGATTYFQKNAIKDNVPIYKPDVVILAFNLNDILPAIFDTTDTRSVDSRWSLSRAILGARKTLDGAFRSQSHLYFLIRERMKGVLRRFAIASPTMAPVAAFDIQSEYGIAAWRQTREVLLDIAAHLEKEHVGFLLAILPVEMQVSRQIADIYRNEYGFGFKDSLVEGEPQKMIKTFAEQHGIAYVDLLPAFQKRPEEKKFFRIYGKSIDWNHPNPVGHRIIAEEIKNALEAHPAMAEANRKAAPGSTPIKQAAKRAAVRRGTSQVKTPWPQR